MPKTHPSLLAFAISALSAAPGAFAQESSAPAIEELHITGQLSRYSALKSDTPIMETARSVSIESELDIIEKGALALDDTFTYSSGVTGKTFGYATRGDWLKVRGLNVPLYQDSLQSLFGNYNNTRPDVYTLEQVEILKGPASVLYGQGSPGGIVNIVSKLPKADSAHEIVAELGNFDRKQLAFDSTGRIGDSDEWLYRVVGVHRDSDTQVDFVEDNTTVIAPSITWRPDTDTDLTLLVNHTETESDTGAQFLPLYGTLYPAPNGEEIENSTYTGEPGYNRYNTETTSVTFLANHHFNSIWSLEVTSRYSDAQADYQQAWTSFIGGDRYVYNDDGSLYNDGLVPRTFYRNDASSEQLAIDTRLRAQFSTGALYHEVLVGAQYQDVTLGDAGYYAFALGYDSESRGPDNNFGDAYWLNVFNPVYGNVPPADYLNSLYSTSPDTTTEDLGLYVNDQISIGNWRVTAGLRVDDTETNTGTARQQDDAVSSALGVLYQFDNGLAPYASYAESFEPVIGDDGRGNTLDPQEGEQVEVGVKYQSYDIPAMVTLAYFDITQSNLSDPTSLAGDYQQQRGEASVEGVELEALVTLGDLDLEFNASHLDTESAEGYHLASVPENQASTWVTWRPAGFQGFKVGGGLRYMGESWGGQDEIRTPSYTLGDLMIGYQAGQWDFTLNARNVADKAFQATCLSRGDCFPGEARNVVGRVRYQF
ncbi:TonB-dependent siderophore receptor [Marinimicrobium agarilyticum]|uniref:TonB-dependent siderophore receptor n=1 Tax=Marinimicrobium agarilyticum TaxID=306546 RepID=UPI00041567FB|nr:TonB-dependent siderophore receptor [Marinimicrobium agarilyticum]